MKIKIISVSDSDKHFQSAIEEYTKRLWKTIEIITVKPEKNWNNEQIISKETDKIIEKISKIQWYKIVLNLNGKNLDTFEFKNIVEKENNVIFIIWWPYWIDYNKLKEHINMEISFGKITLPHWLAKLTLLEQIYRSDSIIKWKEYHY